MSPAVMAIRNTDSAPAGADTLTTAITPMAASPEIFNERSIARHLADACVAEPPSEDALPRLSALLQSARSFNSRAHAAHEAKQLVCRHRHASPRVKAARERFPSIRP